MIPRGAPTKEITRVILDHHASSSNSSRHITPRQMHDLYALGSHKIFLRESLEKSLEQSREAVTSVEAVKIQRAVRGYLARKDYRAKKESAEKIQAAFRGYQVRKEYETVRRGVVALQAQYRLAYICAFQNIFPC